MSDALTRVRTVDIAAGLVITHTTTGRRYTVRTVSSRYTETGRTEGYVIAESDDKSFSLSFRALRADYLRRCKR